GDSLHSAWVRLNRVLDNRQKASKLLSDLGTVFQPWPEGIIPSIFVSQEVLYFSVALMPLPRLILHRGPPTITQQSFPAVGVSAAPFDIHHNYRHTSIVCQYKSIDIDR